jgi:hypothetical protein
MGSILVNTHSAEVAPEVIACAVVFSAVVWGISLPILWAATRAWRQRVPLWIGFHCAGAMPMRVPLGRLGTLVAGIVSLWLALLPIALLITALMR